MCNLQESISLFGIPLTSLIFASGKLPIPKTMEFCASPLDRLSDSGQLFLLLSVPMVLYLERKPLTFRDRKHIYKNNNGCGRGLVSSTRQYMQHAIL